MAFNSFDKLCKAQRDYPKPKFATAVVDKALKKQPNNPYLLTWKADLALQLNSGNAKDNLASLTAIHQLPISDTQLLAYMYTLFIEALRRDRVGPGLNSAGNVALGCWQSTAKTLQSKTARMALWDVLFHTAMQEDCWEDVRFAIVNHNREGPSDKKQSHYSLIIATQLAAEQKFIWAGPQDRMAKLQCDIALKLMKQAYTAPPDDPIAVKNIRDLRFMASIFKRQNRCAELHGLWDDPPKALEELYKRHQSDLLNVMIKALWEQGEFTLLEELCLATIEETRSDLIRVGKPNLWELCAWRWDLWAALLSAVSATRSEQEGRKIISAQIEKCFGTGATAKDRPLRLTHMKLRHHIGNSMLADCKDYFQNHMSLTSCFDDLRPFMRHFTHENSLDFLNFASEAVQSAAMSFQGEKGWHKWQPCQLNLMKFQYMLAVSRFSNPKPDAIEILLQPPLRTLQMGPENPDFAALVIYLLLTLHHRYVCANEYLNPLEVGINTRVLLQATMLARHLVEKDKEKQNRTFSLLAARLHLNLGLGTVAFRLYGHTKCKEMLLDTLSPYVLSRISQTHPFDVKGYRGFSADEELAKAISTIERMEKKTSDFLFTDMPSFLWDQATDTLEFKQKLGSSLTKHLCVAERRRIARLKGESVEKLPMLKYKTYNNISDNVDRAVFPNFEDLSWPDRALNLIMPNFVPNVHWLPETHYDREKASRLLYGEVQVNDFDAYDSKYEGEEVWKGLAYRTRAEDLTQDVWHRINRLVFEIYHPESVVYHQIRDAERFKGMLKNIGDARHAMEKLRMPGDTTLKAEDEPTMFHENMLMYCYGQLEACRGLNKLVERLVEKVIKSKSKAAHPLKLVLPEKFDSDLLEEVKIWFQAVRDVAQSYIDLLKKRGVTAIKAQVRWGNTGEMLKLILSDDDVEYYAKEYVESALEAWSGVLKVKLK